MSNATRLCTAAGVVFAGLSYCAPPSLAQTHQTVGLGINWGFGSDVLPDVPIAVEHVPARLRQLPSHPGDTWIYGSRPVLRTIPFDSIEPRPLPSSVSLYGAPEVTIGRVRVRSGPVFTFYSDAEADHGLVANNSGATREVNQRDLPYRGSGQSLVYYNMYTRASLAPGWMNEASVNVTRHVSAIGGYGFTTFRLAVETGYDRFDRLQTYDTLDAGRINLWRTYGGVEVAFPLAEDHSGGFQVLVGTLRQPIVSNGMTVHAAGHWFMTVGATFHHVLAVHR